MKILEIDGTLFSSWFSSSEVSKTCSPDRFHIYKMFWSNNLEIIVGLLAFILQAEMKE